MMQLMIIFVTTSFSVVFGSNWHKLDSSIEFLLGPVVATYAEAKAGCNNQSAQVANIKTKKFFNSVKEKIRTIVQKSTGSPYSFYIGATWNGSNKSPFLWGDESTIGDSAQWASGEPAAVGNKYCVIMGLITELDSTYKWRSVNCSVTSRYICQRNRAASTTSNAVSPTTTNKQPQMNATTGVSPTTGSLQPTNSSTNLTTTDTTTNTSTTSVPAGTVSTASPSSSTATIGVIAGVVVAVVLLLAAVVFLVWKRMKRVGDQDITEQQNGKVPDDNHNVSETHIYATAKPRSSRTPDSTDEVYATAKPVNNRPPNNTDEVYTMAESVEASTDDVYDQLDKADEGEYDTLQQRR